MKIGLAQINSTVGDFPGNARRILQAYRACIEDGADLVVTPELSLVGYPPKDLLLKKRFIVQCLQALDYLADEIGEVPILVGYVDFYNFDDPGRELRNAAAFLKGGKIVKKIWKTLLPSYDVFDETRYFQSSSKCEPIEYNGMRIGVTICEDIWMGDYIERPIYSRDPVAELKDKGIDLLVNMAASAFYSSKPQKRADTLEVVACGVGVPIVFCNAVGANDQLVFDGHSMVLDGSGNEVANLPGFETCVKVVTLKSEGGLAPKVRGGEVEDVYESLMLGLRDYVNKTGFNSVCVALDGGIDSSVAVTLAVRSLGAERVVGVLMPGPFSKEASLRDARDLAGLLGIQFKEIPIAGMLNATEEAVKHLCGETLRDVTEENAQARLRSVLLMALSNKEGHMVVSSGNKTRLMVGYGAIYGDMNMGLSLLGDVPKTLVFKLARWINRTEDVIPCDVLARPCSGELREGQLDQDVLPAYEILDKILEYYIEYHISGSDLIEIFGYDERIVRWVQRHVDLNQWKRHQSAPCIRVTTKGLGYSRLMPIVQRFVD